MLGMLRTLVPLANLLVLVCPVHAALFPAIPWIEKGTAYVTVFTVNTAAVRDLIPAEFGIVEKPAGTTSGATILCLRFALLQNDTTEDACENVCE
jgi:hypothetical protein